MKNIFLIEGIATSGKTSIIALLKKKIKKAHSVKVVEEAETLMPLIDNVSKKIALRHLTTIIGKMKRSKKDVIIVDRFHFTHAFRTKSNISHFLEIEKELASNFNCLIVVLTVDLSTLRKRILRTDRIRGDAWSKGKKGTINDRITYYSSQQKILLEFAKKTSLPMQVVNSTDMDWERIVYGII
ncbi:MAG: hypothetical protein Q7R79_05060, partial [bacterium]|nr:hypothetical protein [bacterium]